MKKNLFILSFIICAGSLKAQQQQQQQQEPTTFIKYDTVKVVIQSFTDSSFSQTRYLHAFKVFEVRRGDQSAQPYYVPKKYISKEMKDLPPTQYYLRTPSGELLEQYVNWR
jgi:hypothetical protein